MPEFPFTGELITVTEQEERRILVQDIRMQPSHVGVWCGTPAGASP